MASELISREVFATRGVKPIICLMGDLAASGGYFVAAGCDRTFASPTTITGSIGIFFGKFDIRACLPKSGSMVESAFWRALGDGFIVPAVYVGRAHGVARQAGVTCLGLKRVVVSTYQSITGTGQKAVAQMYSERARNVNKVGKGSRP